MPKSKRLLLTSIRNLANFWQDIARDHAIGRIYLPQESLQRFGYSEAEMIANRDHDTSVSFSGLTRGPPSQSTTVGKRWGPKSSALTASYRPLDRASR